MAIFDATNQIDGARVFVVTLGRAVQVTAIATTIDEANEHCRTHRGISQIAQVGDVYLLAVHEDLGVKVKL